MQGYVGNMGRYGGAMGAGGRDWGKSGISNRNVLYKLCPQFFFFCLHKQMPIRLFCLHKQNKKTKMYLIE